MINLKYADRIISDIGFESTHVLKVDQNRLKDFFSVDATWFWGSQPDQIVDGTRVSDCNQVIALVSSNPEDPFSLPGEMTVWVDGKKNILNKSSMIFVPSGVPFGPVQINHMERPIFYVSLGITPDPTVVRDPSLPRYTILAERKEKAIKPTTPTKRTAIITNILHMEDDMVKGSFYVNINLHIEGYGQLPAESAHEHEWPELISLYGCDPEHPRDLGGIYSIDLDGETHYFTKSSLICIPAHVKHLPWRFYQITKPTMTVTASPSGLYYSSVRNGW